MPERQIVPPNLNSSIGRTPLVFSPEGTTRKFSQYVDWLNGKLPLGFEDRKNAFYGCAEIARAIPIDSFYTENNSTLAAIATTLLAFKRIIGSRYPLIDPNETTINQVVAPVYDFIREAEGVQSDLFVDTLFENNQLARKEVTHTWNWTLCSGSQYQGKVLYQISNILILTGLSGFGQLPPEPGPVEGLFQTRIGVSANDYFKCLFGLWTLACQGKMFDSQRIYGGVIGNPQFVQALQGVVNDLSFQSNVDLEHEGLAGFRSFTGKMLAEAIFSRKPIIQLSERNYLIAGHPFLKIQMTTKFLQKALEFARREAGNNPSTVFSQFVGVRLERLVGELCRSWCPEGKIFDEYEYLNTGNEKSSDKIIFETQTRNEVVTLIQIKTKMLRETTHFGVSDNPLESDVDSAFSEMISKSIVYLFNLDSALRAGTLRPSHIELSRRVLNAKKICLLGLSPVLPPVFSSHFFREELIEKVREQVGMDIWNWFSGRYEYGKKWFWHIIDLEEFEIFISSPKEQKNLFDEVSQYVLQSKIDKPPFTGNGNETYPDSFRSFVIKRHARPQPERGPDRYLSEIPELLSIFQRIGDEISQYLFPRTNV